MNLTFLYVALLYAALVAIARRWNKQLDWRVALVFYLLVLGFLFRPLTSSYVDFPADYVYLIEPWSAIKGPYPGVNAEMNDLTLQIVPWAHQVREAWKNLEIPLWNSSNGAGYPLLGNGQSGAFSPLRILGLPLTLGRSITFEAAMKLLAALSLSFLYMRRRGFSESASIITAISFAFCSFITVWLHFPHATVSAFLPAIFLGIDLLFDKRTFHRFLFMTTGFVLLLLGGHPETAAHIVFGSGLYLLFLLLTRRTVESLRSTGLIAAAGVTALLIALPAVAPLLETLPFSQRMDQLRALPWEHEMQDLRFLIPTFQPGFFGSIREQNVWGPGIAETVGGYAGIFGIFGWIYLVLGFLRRRVWDAPATFYLFSAPLLLALALNVPGLTDLFHKLPLFSLAANGRLQLIVCWSLAVLAGIALDQILRQQDRLRWIALGITAVILVLPFLLIQFPGAASWNHAIRSLLPEVLVLVVASLVFLQVSGRVTVAVLLLAVAVACDLFSFGLNRNSDVPESYLYPTTPIIRAMQSLQQRPAAGDPKPFRIAAPNSMLFPNTAAVYGLEDIRSHDPMANGKFLGALRVFTGYSSFEYFGKMRHFDHPFLDYLNVRYILTSQRDALPQGKFVEVYSGYDGKIFRNLDALPRFYAARIVFTEFDDAKRVEMILKNRDWANTVILKRLPSDMIKLVGSDLLSPRALNAKVAEVRVDKAEGRRFVLDVDAPRWTLVISSQPFWPGWKVFRNGKEKLKIIEVNAAFIGFLAPPGKSKIEVIYQPLSFYTSMLVSAMVMLSLLVAGIVFSRRMGSRVEHRQSCL